MPELKIGDAILIKFNSRIGHLSKITNDYYTIQLGQSGPYKTFKKQSIRHATLEEVENAGMYGISFNIVDE
jgi:hypothetical protein